METSHLGSCAYKHAEKRRIRRIKMEYDNGRSLKLAVGLTKDSLTKIAEEKRRALQKAPEGYLLISNKGKRFQYYQVKEGSKGKYLRKKQENIARALAQKKYDERILKLAERELEQIDGMEKKDLFTEMDDIYRNMCKGRQELVIPIWFSDAEYQKEWEEEPFEPKEFREADESSYYTDKGERVRSKSEILIANNLIKNGVPYHYEKPIYLRNGKVLHPDFTVLNVRERKTYYWEHCGMLDMHDYRENMVHRIGDYMDSGIVIGKNLILTVETAQQPLKVSCINQIIRTLFK